MSGEVRGGPDRVCPGTGDTQGEDTLTPPAGRRVQEGKRQVPVLTSQEVFRGPVFRSPIRFLYGLFLTLPETFFITAAKSLEKWRLGKN